MNLDHITINTQSSIKITGSRVLYFDPFRVETDIHDADVVLITHDHYDHLDPESLLKVMKDETIFVVPETIMDSLTKVVPGNNTIICMKPDESRQVEGITVQAVPAYNKLKPFHPKRNRWVGYIATMDETSYYVAGDTDATNEVTAVECDVALLPIGGKFTMSAKEAAEAANAIHPQAVIPTHYGSIVGSKGDADIFRSLVASDIQVEIKL